jgi:hypothetical protein
MKSFVLILALVGTSAQAQTQVKDALLREEIKPAEKSKKGWQKTLSLGANLSSGTSDNVIGQPNGQTNTFGLNVDGVLTNVSDRDEWRNTLKIGESATRTPAIPRYSKVKDELKFESLYLHSIEKYPWMGPYVRASAEAPIFKGEDIRSEARTYAFDDGSTFTGTSIRLTDGFRPLTTRESVGAFFKLKDLETNKVEARLGAGAIQVKADGQRVIKDDAATPDLEVDDLADYEQVGVEGAISWKGSIDEKTSYSLEAEFLSPVVADQAAGDDRSKFELTNWEIKGRLTSKVYDWMAVDYSAKVFKQPQLLDKTQAQTLLMVNLTYQIF